MLSRNPANLLVPKGSGGADADKPLTDPKLTMIAGDVTKKADVDKVFEGDIDGVIVALGGKTSDVGENDLLQDIDCFSTKLCLQELDVFFMFVSFTPNLSRDGPRAPRLPFA